MDSNAQQQPVARVCCFLSPCRQCTPARILKVVGTNAHTLEYRDDTLVVNVFPTLGVRIIAKYWFFILAPPIWLDILLHGATTTTIVARKDGHLSAEYKTNLCSVWYEFSNVSSVSRYSVENDENGSIAHYLSVELRNGTTKHTNIRILDLPDVLSEITQFLRREREETATGK